MVCHLQPSCSQRTSASAFCLHSLEDSFQAIPLADICYIYELILIFLFQLLQFLLLQMQPSMYDIYANARAQKLMLILSSESCVPRPAFWTRRYATWACHLTFRILWSRNLLWHFQYKSHTMQQKVSCWLRNAKHLIRKSKLALEFIFKLNEI